MINAAGVTLAYQGKSVLDNVSFAIEKGNFISLIGPNGAGKTTLVKILLGILKPDAGTVKRVPDLSIGYMPQKLQVEALFPLSAGRFLTLGRKVHDRDLTRVIQEVGAVSILDKPINGLSGGELQRVLLARALLHHPDLLILDEPVQNLDVQGQLYFYELLEKLYRTRGLTILTVSHDLHTVMRATRKVVCLYHHVCCEGKPETVSRHPRFIELFGHDLGKMLKIYQHTHTHSHDEWAA